MPSVAAVVVKKEARETDGLLVDDDGVRAWLWERNRLHKSRVVDCGKNIMVLAKIASIE